MKKIRDWDLSTFKDEACPYHTPFGSVAYLAAVLSPAVSRGQIAPPEDDWLARIRIGVWVADDEPDDDFRSICAMDREYRISLDGHWLARATMPDGGGLMIAEGDKPFE